MSDAAQGEPTRHEVFTTPFQVEPKLELWKTPGSYRRFPGGGKLPAKMKVWRVQNTGKSYGGVVSRLYGFDDSPDAEILTAGYNTGKESGAVGVGRHGSFLQWGFSAPPSKMTDAGRKFFLNCICYIRKFEGKRPLIHRRSSHRMNAIRLAALLNRIKDPKWPARIFPAELLQKYKGDPDGLAKHYTANLELIYRDKRYRVDSELKALGIASNRKPATLERLIELLADPKHAAAVRRLLKRYVKQSFRTLSQWRTWLKENRRRIYFSDVGGYKFRVAPQGYFDTLKAPGRPAARRQRACGDGGFQRPACIWMTSSAPVRSERAGMIEKEMQRFAFRRI